MMDPRKLSQMLLGEWEKTKQPLKERGIPGQEFNPNGGLSAYLSPYAIADVLAPMGTYEDGRIGLAQPKALTDLPRFSDFISAIPGAAYNMIAEPFKRGYEAANTPIPAINDDQAWADKSAAMFDVTSLAPIGGMLGAVENAVGSAGGKLAAGAAKDLPMDQASRMARAKEMGFDTDTTVYHGTPDNRGIWENGFQTAAQRYGKEDPNAVYFFADDKRVANTYADDKRAWDYQNAVPETIPVHLRMENPAVIDWGGRKFRGKEPNEQGYNIHDLIDQARAAGNDGFIINNVIDTYNATGKPTTIRGVFEPNRIRSVNAAFDPAKSDSANLLAANAPTGALPGVAAQTQDGQNPALLDYLKAIGLY